MDAVPLGIVRFHHLEILGSLISAVPEDNIPEL